MDAQKYCFIYTRTTLIRFVHVRYIVLIRCWIWIFIARSYSKYYKYYIFEWDIRIVKSDFVHIRCVVFDHFEIVANFH